MPMIMLLSPLCSCTGKILRKCKHQKPVGKIRIPGQTNYIFCSSIYIHSFNHLHCSPCAFIDTAFIPNYKVFYLFQIYYFYYVFRPRVELYCSLWVWQHKCKIKKTVERVNFLPDLHPHFIDPCTHKTRRTPSDLLQLRP